MYFCAIIKINAMKETLILCALLGAFLTSTANPVSLQTAQSVAYKFMGTNDLQLITTYQTDKNVAAFYVFNTADGFVIVAADDCDTPIIGYSREGRFDPNDVPVQMEDYLQDFVARIQYGIENHIEADKLTSKQWESVKATGRLNDIKNAKTVEPLLTEMWHQGCLYNSLCPTQQGPCDHAEVGCVAVAMGQIMHYWGYPSSGWGSHSYSNSGLTLSANFGNTVYNWELMPDSLTNSSSEAEVEAVATLLFHCGVSVDMSYSTGGSNAIFSKTIDAMKRYFDYARRLHLEKKKDYSDEEWISLLKSNLDQQQPILYSGNGTAGHTFVCDGYDGNGLFHFNWGWGGPGNGFFTMGNLNPLGYNFDGNNQAIFDIIPHYEPCVVTVSVYPTSAGTIEGTGEYHLGEQCTLTAVPAENCEFYYWKQNGKIVSYNTTYTINTVNNDINDIEAFFSYIDIKQIEASYITDTIDPNYSCVSLSWNYNDSPWVLVKQFETSGEQSVATDGEYIYTCNPSEGFSSLSPSTFGKYTMDGELVEFFELPVAYPDDLTFDGNYFYCPNNKNSYNVFQLYCYDLAHKAIIDSLYMSMQFTLCAYNPENDGFWLGIHYNNGQLTLKDRQGQTLMVGPSLSTSFLGTNGFGVTNATDGNPHLLILNHNGNVLNYDISNKSLISLPGLDVHNSISGAFIGKYNGKDAIYAVLRESFYYGTISSSIYIYEINNNMLAQIVNYRPYRADSEGDTLLLADEVSGSSYIDSTWKEASVGVYRYGISLVFANGIESEIVWSEPIEKTNIGIHESPSDPEEPPVQKVFENGQIIIIKDGKRYNISGQQLN